jgi:hypothetical protein
VSGKKKLVLKISNGNPFYSKRKKMNQYLICFFVITLFIFDSCIFKKKEKWNLEPNLTSEVEFILDTLNTKNVHSILKLMDDKVGIGFGGVGGNKEFLKSKDSQDFLNGKGYLFMILFDTQMMRNNYYINEDMFSFQEAMHNMKKLRFHKNEIKFYDHNYGYYILRYKCNKECKITYILISTEFGFINSPLTEDEKLIIKYIKTKDHEKLYPYLGNIVDVKNTYCGFQYIGKFEKKIDGQEFLKKKNFLYDIFFTIKPPAENSDEIFYQNFSNFFSSAFRYNLQEYEIDGMIKRELSAVNRSIERNTVLSFILEMNCDQSRKCKIINLDCKEDGFFSDNLPEKQNKDLLKHNDF